MNEKIKRRLLVCLITGAVAYLNPSFVPTLLPVIEGLFQSNLSTGDASHESAVRPAVISDGTVK